MMPTCISCISVVFHSWICCRRLDYMIISSSLFPPFIQNYVKMILNIVYYPDINLFLYILSCSNVSEPPTLLQQRKLMEFI